MSIDPNTKTSALTQQTVKGFAWSSAGIVVQGVLQLYVLAVLARLLSPHDFGVVGMAMIFISFVERVGFIGIGPALVQRKELTGEIVSAAFTMCFFLGVFICAFFFAAAPLIGAFFREEALVTVLRVLSVIFFLESIGTVSENILQRELKFKKLLGVNSGAYFIGNACVGVGLAYFGYGIWALVAATITTRVVKVLLLLMSTPQHGTFSYHPKETRELINVGFGFSLGRLISFVALNGDNFVVGRLLGAAALGMYGRAYQLMTLPANYFGQILEKVLFPAMAKRQNDRQQLGQVFLWSIEASALVGLPASVFMWLTAEEMITVLFGKQWLSVTPTLRILSLGMFFRLCYKNSVTLIRSLGAVYKHAARQVVYALIVVCGSCVGCLYGLEYVGAAVSLAVLVNYLILSQLGLKLLSLTWKDFVTSHLTACWCSAIVFLSLVPITEFARSNQWPPLLTLISGAIATSVAMVIGLKLAPKTFRPLLFNWLLQTFRFERLGPLGKTAIWILRT